MRWENVSHGGSLKRELAAVETDDTISDVLLLPAQGSPQILSKSGKPEAC